MTAPVFAHGKPVRRRWQAVRVVNADDVRAALDARESEEDFLQWTLRMAKLFGWTFLYHTRDSRGSHPGQPDLILIRINPDDTVQGIAAELKRQTGKTTPAQDVGLYLYGRMGFQACVWRPSDRNSIVRMLSRKG